MPKRKSDTDLQRPRQSIERNGSKILRSDEVKRSPGSISSASAYTLFDRSFDSETSFGLSPEENDFARIRLERNNYLRNLDIVVEEREKLKSLQGSYICCQPNGIHIPNHGLELLWDEERLWCSFKLDHRFGVIFIQDGPSQSRVNNYDMQWRAENTKAGRNERNVNGILRTSKPDIIQVRFFDMPDMGQQGNRYDIIAKRSNPNVSRDLPDIIRQWNYLGGGLQMAYPKQVLNSDLAGDDFGFDTGIVKEEGRGANYRTNNGNGEDYGDPEEYISEEGVYDEDRGEGDGDYDDEDEDDDDDDGDDDDLPGSNDSDNGQSVVSMDSTPPQPIRTAIPIDPSDDESESEYEPVPQKLPNREDIFADSDIFDDTGYALSPTTPRMRSLNLSSPYLKACKDFISGMYDIQSKDITPDWYHAWKPPGLWFQVDKKKGVVWGRFELARYEGRLRFQKSPERIKPGQELEFEWEGIDTCTKKTAKRNKKKREGEGSVTISGDGSIKGVFYDMHKKVKFSGQKRNGVNSDSGIDVAEYRAEWKRG